MMKTKSIKLFPRELFHYRLMIDAENAERLHLYPARIAPDRILAIIPDGRAPEKIVGENRGLRLERSAGDVPLEFTGRVRLLGDCLFRGYPVRLVAIIPATPVDLGDDLIALQMALDGE